MTHRLFTTALLATIICVLFAFVPITAYAGIYDADQEETYKEYWVPHSEFTAGFRTTTDADGREVSLAGCPDSQAEGGSWYLEPWPKVDVKGDPCEKHVTVHIPDDFSQALRAELYLDLWRNGNRWAFYKVNDGRTERSDIGDSWSRTPLVTEIKLSDLKQGENILTFTTASAGYHIHDIAIRIYFDNSHPLRDGNGALMSAPTGQLQTIAADNGSKSPSAGGTLVVNTNDVDLTARTTSPTTFVEFHAFYEGYDEDNNRLFRDWHNRGRNNWYPGGTDAKATGGTIDHIGTKLTPGGTGDYTVSWALDHVLSQSGVKFKVRLVQEVTESNGITNYIVNEAAGGVSSEFTLSRNRAVMQFMSDNFTDSILCNGKTDGVCNAPEIRRFNVPVDVAPNSFDKVFFLGSYWQKPELEINEGARELSVFGSGQDKWEMGNLPLSPSQFNQGDNFVDYWYNGSGFGHFIEYPGPMVVFAQTSNSSDNTAPTAAMMIPNPTTDVSVDTDVEVILSEMVGQLGHGIDRSTIKLWIGNQQVTPVISGFSNEYLLTYQPPAPFAAGAKVTVGVEACDLDGNCLSRTDFSFTTLFDEVDFDGVSDAFNTCLLNDGASTPWTWTPGAGGATYTMTGTQVAFNVPAGVTLDQAPRLLQSTANGSRFELEAYFVSPLVTTGQVEGLVVSQDEDDFLRFDFVNEDDVQKLVVEKSIAGAVTKVWELEIEEDVTPAIRVERTAAQWQVSYTNSPGGVVAPGDSHTFTHNMTVNGVGALAANTSGQPFTALLDYFLNVAAPVQNDTKILNFADLPVTVDPPGGGTVAGAPLAPTPDNPTCGTPLQLTATPAEGYRFDNWFIADNGGSSYTSTANPHVDNFLIGSRVTATFVQNEHAVTTNVVSNGVGVGGEIIKDPDFSIFKHGDVLTLTARANVGWVFDGWSGDLPASLDPATASFTVTVASDLNFVATFTQLNYTLNVTTDGSGNGVVVVAPQQPDYLHGITVTLRALVAADGSKFGGWSGDLPDGADLLNPTLELVMDGDKSITATFTLGYVLLTEVSGEGAIVLNPDKVEYAPNEQVTLQAVPASGWRFSHWEEDLIGAETTKTLVMDRQKRVRAVFVENGAPLPNPVYLPFIVR